MKWTIEDEVVVITTASCIGCGKDGKIRVMKRDFERWQDGELIQKAFPEMPVGDREQLMSGMHSACFDKLWKDAEE